MAFSRARKSAVGSSDMVGVAVLMLTSCSRDRDPCSELDVAMRGRVPCCDACVTWQSPVNPGGGVVSLVEACLAHVQS